MSEAAQERPRPAALILNETAWAVVDAARTPRVLHALAQCALPHHLLYEGPVDGKIADIGPYLVPLWRNPAGARRLIEEAWGRAWGIFLHTGANRDELRRHLRKFLTVVTERRRKLLFRYYDPRVLGPYLPTCTAEELRTFFGPIDDFIFEGEERSEAQVCRIEGEALSCRTVLL